MTLFLVGDVLDQQVIDSKGTNAGRVDGIVLSLCEGQAPRVTHIEVSPITMLARLSDRLANWYADVDRRVGPHRGHPFRIAWSTLRREKHVFRMDRDIAHTPINAVERWLREKIVERIPGA